MAALDVAMQKMLLSKQSMEPIDSDEERALELAAEIKQARQRVAALMLEFRTVMIRVAARSGGLPADAAEVGAVVPGQAGPASAGSPQDSPAGEDGSVRARMLKLLQASPRQQFTVEEIHQALGIDDKQAVRDAGRRLVADEATGVKRVSNGVFAFEPTPSKPSARAHSVGRSRAAARRHRRGVPAATGSKAPLTGAIFRTLRERKEPIPAQQVVKLVSEILGIEDHKPITDRLWRLRKDAKIRGKEENGVMVYWLDQPGGESEGKKGE